MEYPSFSVLITVYSKEDPEFLNQAIRSVIKQTVVPDQIIDTSIKPSSYS